MTMLSISTSKKSPNCNLGKLPRGTARALIIHYTGGGDPKWTASRFADRISNVSAHYVLGRTPQQGLWQCVGLDSRAWHCGVSAALGRSGVNDFSIGIELANYGWFDKQDANGIYRLEGASRISAPEGLKLRKIDGKWWEEYSAYQYDIVAELYHREIVLMHPGILLDREHVLGHSEIATPKGRKQDPGPAWDWDRLMTALRTWKE